jgi:hypothetical protein
VKISIKLCRGRVKREKIEKPMQMNEIPESNVGCTVKRCAVED